MKIPEKQDTAEGNGAPVNAGADEATQQEIARLKADLATATKRYSDLRPEYDRLQNAQREAAARPGANRGFSAPSPVAGAESELEEVLGVKADVLAAALMPHLQPGFVTPQQAIQLAQQLEQRTTTRAAFDMGNDSRRNSTIRALINRKADELYQANPTLSYDELLVQAETAVQEELEAAGFSRATPEAGTAPEPEPDTKTPVQKTSKTATSPAKPSAGGVPGAVAEGAGGAPGGAAKTGTDLPSSEDNTEDYVDGMNAIREQTITGQAEED